MKKKVLSLLLAVVMTFSLAVTANAAEETAQDLDGDIVILHTNDVHGAISGYAKVAALKDAYEARGAYVLLMDAGDFIQGDPTVSTSEGATAVELMNLAGYDVASMGNHEFDYGYQNLKDLEADADFTIVDANVLYNGQVAFEDNVVFTAPDGTKIGVFGLDTPETATKAHPAKIQGVTFLAGDKMFDCAQDQVDALEAEGCEYIICLGHLGIDAESTGNRSIDLLEKVEGIDVFIDGHSHTVMENKQVYDAAGKAVTLTQTGSYLANVGKMTIAEDGAITTELISTADVSDAAVAATAEAWINDVDAMLGEQIATTDIKFYINDPATGKRRIRMGETNLGDFVADGIYTYFNEIEQLDCDIAMMNGGGIRTDVDAGKWTFKTCKQVSPFGNVACLMSVTGKQIQDALEFGARFVGPEGKENGGFLHVAGATYEIHTDIPNTVPTDDKNVWMGSATGTPRVQNVRIYNKKTGAYEPLDLNRTYALAGMNYTLRNLGDGFAMFDGAELIKDYVSEDYLVMSTYAMIFDAVNDVPVLSSANSPLASYPGYLLNYENPYGAGRIQVV